MGDSGVLNKLWGWEIVAYYEQVCSDQRMKVQSRSSQGEY